MTKEFIQSIFDKIAAELPDVKHVGLFNDDFTKLDEGTKASFTFPAIFLSFPEDLLYIPTGSGVQQTEEFRVRLHIADKYMSETNVLDLFDLKQSVYSTFQGFSPNTAAGSMTRISETADESRRGYYVFLQDYSVKLVDDTKFINKQRVLVNAPTLDVGTEVIIDPNTTEGVRTGIIQDNG